MNLHGLSRKRSAMAAVDEAVPAGVLSAALYDRFRPCEERTFGEKVLSPTRKVWWAQRGQATRSKPHGG
jgi:6-phosphogluconate dehydrogenase (decarboxylating)